MEDFSGRSAESEYVTAQMFKAVDSFHSRLTFRSICAQLLVSSFPCEVERYGKSKGHMPYVGVLVVRPGEIYLPHQAVYVDLRLERVDIMKSGCFTAWYMWVVNGNQASLDPAGMCYSSSERRDSRSGGHQHELKDEVEGSIYALSYGCHGWLVRNQARK